METIPNGQISALVHYLAEGVNDIGVELVLILRPNMAVLTALA